MIKYIIATKRDIDLLMSSRLEMLKAVNGFSENDVFSDDFIENCTSISTTKKHIV